MEIIELAKTLAKLTPEQMTVLATHLTSVNYDQADRMQNYLYAQIVDAAEFLEESVQ
jgi:hypothetical protein